MVPWEYDRATGHVTRGEASWSVLGLGSGSVEDFLGRVHEADRCKLLEFFGNVTADRSLTAEFRYSLPAGRTIWLGTRARARGETGLIGVTFDITERKQSEEDARWNANHDPLTGLANRALFQSRFEQALKDARAQGTSVSLLLVDLDDFKDVNDTLGHDAGDALLMEVANRLSAVTRECDMVARLGGDEFGLIVVEPLRLEHAARLAESVLERLQEPFEYEGVRLAARGSIGVASYPDHDRSQHELMKDADIALYRAKSDGRNRAVVYSSALRSSIEKRVSVVGGIREALASEQVVPFYQPKVCLESGRIVGFEALARWIHPTKGLLTPGYFAAAFENSEIALLMGARMVQQVASDTRAWLDRGLDCGRIAINFSSAEFAVPHLAEQVLSVLDGAGVPPSRFEVEVTESVFLGRNSAQTYEILRRFHAAGVQVALDDFGTGFASLSHLKQFPVGHIKIDQTFVRDLERDDDDAAIVRAVIGLGRSLGLQVTAEGVETAGQAERLRRKGCPFAQGYLFSKPVAGSRVAWLLTEWRSPLDGHENGLLRASA
jgi:diguanylate cyclase (GGDEF)-like protein